MSKRELWEEVQVDKVAVGERVKTYDGSEIVWTEKEVGKAVIWKDDCVFRRIPDADDPRVLRRAIEIMHSDFASSDSQSIEGYIREAKEDIENKARRKLESEGNDE